MHAIMLFLLGCSGDGLASLGRWHAERAWRRAPVAGLPQAAAWDEGHGTRHNTELLGAEPCLPIDGAIKSHVIVGIFDFYAAAADRAFSSIVSFI